MNLFDTHVHFRDNHGPAEGDAWIARADAAGVARMVAVGGDEPMNRAACAAATRHPGRVWAAVGLDRDRAAEAGGNALADSVARVGRTMDEATAAAARVVAVGEIGLDFHYTPQTAPLQGELFAAQMALAAERRLPVIIHSREADEATLSALRAVEGAWGQPGVRGVLHCFTGDAAFARSLIELGLHISFSGILTFRNADALRAVARDIPADRLLIETDAPFLAPVPHRGQRNEPAFVAEVARALAEVRGMTVEALAELTTGNARRLFGV